MIQVRNRQINTPDSLVEHQNYDGEDVKIAIDNLSTACKCVYCERDLSVFRHDNHSKTLAIEHFYPKDLYPEKKFEWKNLFWICINCNSTKLAYDTGRNPFIHPENDNPEHYLTYDYSHRIKVGTHSPDVQKSENTIQKTMGKRLIEGTWGSVILIAFQKLEIDLEQKSEKYKKIKLKRAKIKHLQKWLEVMKELKTFATDEKEYAGRRRFLIRQSPVIQAITHEINNHQTELGLTEPFEWVW